MTERGTSVALIQADRRAISLLVLLLLGSVAVPTRADTAAVREQWTQTRLGVPCRADRLRGAGITVAVIDSGVDLRHPDLIGQVRDDGYDFVDNDPDPSDENGHGTHVAGIIAAADDNAGIVGIAPAAQLLPVRVMNDEGWGTQEQIAAGIRFATDKQVQVINLSIGATLYPAEDDDLTRTPVAIAVRQALDAGIVVVVAAGNDFVPFPNIVAYTNPDVILVAASDSAEALAGFSNSGPWVDVVAPGQQIISTMPTYSVYLTSSALPPTERFQQDYDSLSGTSQAAPHVAGLVALLLAAAPDLSPADVRDILRASASTEIYRSHPAAFRRLHELGAGRIAVCAALERLASPRPEAQ